MTDFREGWLFDSPHTWATPKRTTSPWIGLKRFSKAFRLSFHNRVIFEELYMNYQNAKAAFIYQLFIYQFIYWFIQLVIINLKNQFFMQNTNFISFWSTRGLLDLSLILLFLQTIQLSENIRSHTYSQKLLYLYKRSSC